MNRHALLALLLTGANLACATPTVSGPGACGIRAVDNESFVSCDGDRPAEAVPFAFAAKPAARLVSPPEAWRSRHDRGAHSLIVDIRGTGDVIRDGASVGTDANVPYLQNRSGVMDAALLRNGHPRFNPHFLQRMDELLVAHGLRHDAPLILLCRSGTLSRMAAELLIEHGYGDVRIVAGGFVGAEDAAPQPGAGWKRAGLPWTRNIDVEWMKLGR